MWRDRISRAAKMVTKLVGVQKIGTCGSHALNLAWTGPELRVALAELAGRGK
jgi:hypothetical protein